MGGAYLLARALHETVDYREALRQYEQQMYAYVQAQQKSARGFAKSFLPGSPFGLFVQQTMTCGFIGVERSMGSKQPTSPKVILVAKSKTVLSSSGKSLEIKGDQA